MRLAILTAVAALGLMLGGCPDKAALDLSTRPALPPVPADLAACFARTFPEIPDAAFGRAAAVRIIANAKLLDRAKTACGERALAWIALRTAADVLDAAGERDLADDVRARLQSIKRRAAENGRAIHAAAQARAAAAAAPTA